MAETKDYSKLQKFVEAAITNPLHPVYKLGMQKSAILQHYAINVVTLESIKPAQWFVEYPHYTEKLEAVMALCEVDAGATNNADAGPQDIQSVLNDMSAAIVALQKQVADLQKQSAPPAQPIDPAGQVKHESAKE